MLPGINAKQKLKGQPGVEPWPLPFEPSDQLQASEHMSLFLSSYKLEICAHCLAAGSDSSNGREPLA